MLERLSVYDKNSKAFFIVLTILSDKVDSGSIIQYLPNIAENLLHLMSSNNSVSNALYFIEYNMYLYFSCSMKSFLNFVKN